MRAIKFRAWDKQEGRMIVDRQDFIPLIVTSAGVFRLSATHQGNLYSLVDPARFELMQYTGLTDKNGKEIYEGDIAKYSFLGDLKHGGTGVIELANSCFHVDRFLLWDYAEGSKDWVIEIIGNIHENPELLYP